MIKREKGFTLIELLVVIAIIAILAAILFPIFIKAKKNALQAKCLSNLKQVGGAMSLYLQDSGDKYPAFPARWGASEAQPGDAVEANSPTAAGLARVLQRYTKSNAIWMCPDGAKNKPDSDSILYPSFGQDWLVDYILLNGTKVQCNYFCYPLNVDPPANPNPSLPKNGYYPEFCRGWTVNEAVAMWGKTFTSPYGEMWVKGYHQPEWNNRLIQDAYQISGKMWRTHKGGTNILYHDGHAKFVRDYRPSDDE